MSVTSRRIIVLFIGLLVMAAAEVCVKKGPCSCMYSNGTGFDLQPAMKSNFYKVQSYQPKMNNTQYELLTYYFNPCSDALPNVTVTSPNNECGTKLSACLVKYTFTEIDQTKSTFEMDKGVCDFLGSTNHTEFGTDDGVIIFANGPSETWIHLICSQAENQLQVYSLADPHKVELAFYSPDSCLKVLEESGRSFGSTLLIIFFSLVVFYLVLGVLTRKFLMGATGLEVVPNLNFWSDLPNLVREGWAFARNGFKIPSRGLSATGSPDPNSYDSI